MQDLLLINGIPITPVAVRNPVLSGLLRVFSAAEKAGTEIRLIGETTTAALGEAILTIYPPLGDGGDNEQGLTLLCSVGDFDLLDTGDMNSTTEELLLSAYDLPEIEVLIAGHHGSKYSTSQALLDAVTPEIAVISVGSNSYGHPTDQILHRLADSGITVYRTDLQGTIHFTVN